MSDNNSGDQKPALPKKRKIGDDELQADDPENSQGKDPTNSHADAPIAQPNEQLKV